MKTNLTSQEPFESTYALLVRAEKERSALETLAYFVVIACAIFSISQFAQQRVTVPTSVRGYNAATAAVQMERPA